MSAARTTLLVMLSGVAAACETAGPTREVFIASQSDFAEYTTWQQFSLGVAMNSGHPVGDELGYRNLEPEHGAYPVGTILVKEIRVGDTPQQWELFGMMKRGGHYNPSGAMDWEFATLRLNDDLIPIILTRGANPGDADSQGHGYGAASSGVTCNRCHGIAGTEATDHVLDEPMRP